MENFICIGIRIARERRIRHRKGVKHVASSRRTMRDVRSFWPAASEGFKAGRTSHQPCGIGDFDRRVRSSAPRAAASEGNASQRVRRFRAGPAELSPLIATAARQTLFRAILENRATSSDWQRFSGGANHSHAGRRFAPLGEAPIYCRFGLSWAALFLTKRDDKTSDCTKNSGMAKAGRAARAGPTVGTVRVRHPHLASNYDSAAWIIRHILLERSKDVTGHTGIGGRDNKLFGLNS